MNGSRLYLLLLSYGRSPLILTLGGALLAGLAGCANRNAASAQASRTHTGFQEAATASGIHFFMHFLPNEQGEVYKINLYDHGSGVAVGDIDGDGHDDIYFLNQMGPNALFRNRGDGTFADVTEKAGVGLGDRICVGAVFADYDNDGREDLFVTSIRGGNVLYHNEGGGRFRDVTKEAGVDHVGHSQSALFFDYDRDGRLDLFVTNTADWTLDDYNADGRYYAGRATLAETMQSPIEHNLLYHNNGDGTFTNVTAKAGLEGLGWAADAVSFDYDEDGWPDLFVTNMFGRSQLYRNRGDGGFEDVTDKALGKTSWGGMGARAFDYDNDGRLDLLTVDMHSDMWVTPEFPASAVEEHQKYPTMNGRMGGPGSYSGPGGRPSGGGPASGDVVYGNTLFHNLGHGRFEEVSDRAGMETFWPWGIATGDFDNDGYVDVFIPSGMGYPFFYWRDYLMMNNGNGTFTDRSREDGIDPPPGGMYQEKQINGRPAPRSSRSAAVADFDADGRLDLVVNNFNGAPYYFRNRFKTGNYVAFSLTGTRSNRDALGTLVTLISGKMRMVREVAGGGGYLSCSSKVVHFGLGKIRAVDRVEIRWPSGARQTIAHPSINSVHQVKEPAK